jgi:hypothetical protein
VAWGAKVRAALRPLRPWWVRRYERYEQQLARQKKIHSEKQIASSHRKDARIAEYAAEARARIAEARAEAEEKARRTIEAAVHQARVAAAAQAAERERQRLAAYQAGLEQGRKEAQTAAAFLTRELEQIRRDVPCTKIRLNDREHAEKMVEHVLETAGVRTEPYACPVCPRQLFGRGRFWHVRTIDDPAERRRKGRVMSGKVDRQVRERQLGRRLPPETVELLRAKTRSED